MVALAKLPVFMSVDEFLAWKPGDGQAWQLVLNSVGLCTPLAQFYRTIRLAAPQAGA